MLASGGGRGDEAEEAVLLREGDAGASVIAYGEQLFRAAEALYRGAPWRHAHDEQVVRLDAPELGIAAAAISIIGALGQTLGFLVFPSLDGQRPSTTRSASRGRSGVSSAARYRMIFSQSGFAAALRRRAARPNERVLLFGPADLYA